MPSNPTLPEDVREKAIERVAHLRAITTQSHHLLSSAELVDAIAPLIIEWARKDQAEVDAQIAACLFDDDNGSNPSDGPIAAEIRNAIRAQFTPETTGAPDDQQ